MSTDRKSIHKAVLLHEVVEGLIQASRDTAKQSSLIYLDGTLGGAGHALAMAEAMKGKLTIIGLDRDSQAIERAEETLKGKAEKVILETEDFRNLDKVLAEHKIAKVDRILFDLGLSSDEIEASGRGFSFQKDEPLLMTFGDPSTYPFTAETIINGWKEEDIANVIYAYGEERYSRRIAKAIVDYRRKKRIETSGELAEIIKASVPSIYRRGRIHPATRTFQALRIAVNDELAALKEGLIKAWNALDEGGRLAVISFHSLEDRIVKEFFREKVTSYKRSDESIDDLVKSCPASRLARAEGDSQVASQATSKERQDLQLATCNLSLESNNSQGIIITKKPITASSQEISENQRSRSAKLRIIERLTTKYHENNQ